MLCEYLPIKLEKYFSEEDDVEFKTFLNKASSRISALMQKITKHKAYESGKISRDDILIDIENDCPNLIKSESQTLSQTSTTSTMSSSQSKVLEYLNSLPDQIEPEPVKRKAFDDLGLQQKRLRSDDVYEQIYWKCETGHIHLVTHLNLVTMW